MSRKSIFKIICVIAFLITISGALKAQNCNENSNQGFGNIELQPECPPTSIEPEIVGASFSDGWWDVVVSPNTTSYIDQGGFTNYSEEARFKVNNRVITDMNPASPSSLYCPVVQIATVLKYHSRELVQRTQNDWDWGGLPLYSTTASYEFDPSGITEPFDLFTETCYGCEVPPAPLQPPAPIEPEIINVGGLGISFIAMHIVLPTDLNSSGYLYEKVAGCNVYCNAPQYNRTPAPPSACIQLQIPYGPLGCSAIVRVVKNVQACVCFDLGWN